MTQKHSFSLPDKDGKMHTLNDELTVIFFYPKDSTPGCTIEAKSFSNSVSEFEARGVTVFGISGGDDKTKEKFSRLCGLNVTLLSDTDFSVASAFGCYAKKKFMGREYMGINRNTYILKNKEIIHIFENVKPVGHVKEVLAFIENL